MIKTFVINMKDSKNRWESVKTQLERFWIDYERIEWTNPKLMTKHEIDLIYDEDLSLKKHPPKWMNLATIGCAHSHFKIYERIVKEKIPLALVLEDDVIISEKVKLLYERFDCFIENKKGKSLKWEYLSMNYGFFGLKKLCNHICISYRKLFLKKKILSFIVYVIGWFVYSVLDFFPWVVSKMFWTIIIKRYRPFYLSWWYFVSYYWAKKLLEINNKVFTYADYLPEMCTNYKYGGLKFFVTVPVLVVQDRKHFISTIDHDC